MLEEKGIAVTSNQSVKLKDIKVNPASLNMTIEAKGKNNTPFDISVEISEDGLHKIIEEMKKTSDYIIAPIVWYTSTKYIDVLLNKIKHEEYGLLMQDATGVVKSIAKKDITAKKVHDLVNNGGSWLMVPTSLHTLKESDVDWDKLDYCGSIMQRLEFMRQDCFGVGLMVSKDTDDNERYFEYRAWNKEDICIHNEEDAGRLAYITTVFTIPSFEDSNEEMYNY